LSRPYSPRSSSSSASFVRVNGKIRAREVRVIGVDGKQLGVLSLSEALNQARASGVDLVEIAPNAVPPVCRLVDFGKFRYEQAKKDKESKKHQHANKVKEIQLSPKIDPHDLGVKLSHAVDFLCEDMKVKVVLKFRGREMAHTEIGFQLIQKFLKDITPYGHPDSDPKLLGRAITVMLSPLPRNKRAKHPQQTQAGAPAPEQKNSHSHAENNSDHAPAPPAPRREHKNQAPAKPAEGFQNNPFARLASPE
jgi:translation initiation factor IF-3